MKHRERIERGMAEKQKTVAKEPLTEEEKELRKRKRALKKKRLEKKREREEARLRELLEDEEETAPAETEEERQLRFYTRGKKKLRFAPHMYRREDQADMYRQAAELFAKTPGYEDADVLCGECTKQAEAYRKLYVEETCAQVQADLPLARTFTDCWKIGEKLNAIAEETDVSKERAQLGALEQRLRKKQKQKKIFTFLFIAVVILAILFILYIQSAPLLGVIFFIN